MDLQIQLTKAQKENASLQKRLTAAEDQATRFEGRAIELAGKLHRAEQTIKELRE